jgi:hypothetical protein
MLAIATLAVGCGSSDHAVPDSTTARDAAADVGIDAAPVTPWNAPTGDLLAGVTLADGWTDLRALRPPLAIEGGWTDSLFATSDGKQLLLAYDEVDFSTFFISMGASAPLNGGPLAGLAPTTFKLFQADLGASDWTITQHPLDALVPDKASASPATNDAGDLLIFTDFTSGPNHLYYSQLASNVWSAPTHLDFNSVSCNDDNAKIIGDLATSVTIYFESNRATPVGTEATCPTTNQRTLYTTTYSGGVFSPVAKVPGIAEGTTSNDSQPWASHDQNTLLFTSIRSAGYAVYQATRSGGSFGAIHAIATPTATVPFGGNVTLLGEASIVEQPEGELLYMMCGVASNLANAMTYNDADHVALVPCVARRPH